MDISLIIIWISMSLFFTSAACLAGRRWGVSIPIAYLAALAPISTILVTKIVEVGPYVLPASILAYPMIFFVTDVLNELWGEKEARKAVWLGLYASVVTVVLIYFTSLWSAPMFAQANADMFNSLFSFLPRALLGGLIAYTLSQHLDVSLFHWIRKITNTKHLWLRNNGSTMLSQFVDSIIFITIAFYGVFPIIPMIIGQIVVKVLVALFDTPFIYAVVYISKRIKQI